MLFYILHPFVSLFRKERCFKNRIDSFHIFNRTRIICILVVTVIPIIKDQIDALIDNLPYFGHEIEQAARRFGESNLLSKIQENLNINVANMVKEYTVDFTKSLSSVTGNVTGFLSTVTESCFDICNGSIYIVLSFKRW